MRAEVNSECDMLKLAIDIMVMAGVVESGVLEEDVLRGLYKAPIKGERFYVPKYKNFK